MLPLEILRRRENGGQHLLIAAALRQTLRPEALFSRRAIAAQIRAVEGTHETIAILVTAENRRRHLKPIGGVRIQRIQKRYVVRGPLSTEKIEIGPVEPGLVRTTASREGLIRRDDRRLNLFGSGSLFLDADPEVQLRRRSSSAEGLIVVAGNQVCAVLVAA